MKKIITLTAIASLGFFSSYSQTATATRHVEDINAPKKVEEVKVDNSFEAEKKAASMKRQSTNNTADLQKAQDEEKMKIEEMEKAKKTKAQPANKSVKASSTNLTPVKKN